VVDGVVAVVDAEPFVDAFATATPATAAPTPAARTAVKISRRSRRPCVDGMRFRSFRHFPAGA
jgi:hypothetical protein